MQTVWDIHSFESLGSTQDRAKNYLAEGKPLPFVIRADIQTAGRGRSGNSWVSPKGNLYASIVIPIPRIAVREVGQYSFLVAVALMKTLTEMGVVGAVNKWPNDILVNGQKIAGILLESDLSPDGSVEVLIIGVGVNISYAPDGAIALCHCEELLSDEAIQNRTVKKNNWIAASAEPPRNDAELFLTRFLVHLQSHLDMMSANGFAPIREEWLSNAYGIGTGMRVRLPRETFYGRFLGMDESGALMVHVEGEEVPRVVYSGDVFFDKKDD